MKKIFSIFLAALVIASRAATLEQLVADRAAIEGVYQTHRTGTTATLEPALPAAELRRLVERDVAREQALRSRYGVETSSNLVAAEVARIEATTRAPAILAEIKAALGNDPARFAEAFVKPIVVERELRRRFENDDALHFAPRRDCEALRTNLLASRGSGGSAAALGEQLTQSQLGTVMKLTWNLQPHALKTAGAEMKEKEFYFDQLPSQLREVLAVQLRRAGDVSAVIETPETFLLYVALEKSEAKLAVLCLSLPKIDCDAWVSAQSHSPK